MKNLKKNYFSAGKYLTSLVTGVFILSLTGCSSTKALTRYEQELSREREAYREHLEQELKQEREKLRLETLATSSSNVVEPPAKTLVEVIVFREEILVQEYCPKKQQTKSERIIIH